MAHRTWAPGPSTGSSSGCAPRPHALCCPSSPGPGGGSRMLVSSPLSQALEKVASFGLLLQSGLAHRCPEAQPARESPPAVGWRAWRRWHWLAAPAAPPCCPAPRWASWPGLRPLQPGWRTLGPPRGCGQEFRALAFPVLPGRRGEDREAAGRKPCALGGCRNPLRHTSGRRGDPLTGHRAWEPQSLGQGGTELWGQAHRPHDLEGPTCRRFLLPPAPHGVLSQPAGIR